MYSGGMSKPLALAYIRVSTTDQVENGASLDAQRATLIGEAERRGWAVEVVSDAGLSGKNLNRPALQAALARLDKGKAQFLLAIRLDRISRSVADFAGLLDRADKRHWGLVLLSPNIDTSDPAGRFTANVLASAAQYERELIGARTREGMAQRKAEGAVFGRVVDASTLSVYRDIATMHDTGMSINGIARLLTEQGVTTANGGVKWYASTVKAVLTSQTLSRLTA